MRTITKTIDINAHITNITCEVTAENDISKALISFDNLGYGVITAVKFNATGFNSFGDIVQVGGKEKFYLIIQDISIEKNTAATNLKAKLPNSDIRKLELEECQICYADGSVSNYDGVNLKTFEIQRFLDVDPEKSVLDAIHDVVSPKATCAPLNLQNGWLCVCERYNSNEYIVCSNCRAKRTDVFKLYDANFISSIVAQHKKNEIERKEKAIQEAKAKKKAEKKQKIIVSIGVIASIILLSLISCFIVISNRSTYSSESEMRAALQGTYTWYNSSGDARKQIIIDGDNYIYRWKNDDTEIKHTLQKWNYRTGSIRTFETLIVTKRGDLKDNDGDIFEKGGYMSSKSSLYSSYYSYESGSSVLKISVDRVTNNSSYTVCTGSVKNTGKNTYKYIEVKGAFKDSIGNVIDTDWTYAAGSEGLAPGESTTFRLSVDKNTKISSCSVTLLDYQ